MSTAPPPSSPRPPRPAAADLTVGEAARRGLHVPMLDGVRGLAILLVMVYHQTVMNPAAETAPAAVRWLDAAWLNVMHAGWCGVDLFFVLSGFLITGILFDAKGTRRYFVNFYARRTVRIFPLYYAVVFVSLVLLPLAVKLAGGAGPLVAEKMEKFARLEGSATWYWLYLSNFSIAAAGQFRHAILDISWSLAIEEQFYIVWPTVVYLFSRSALVRICLGLVGFALLFRVAGVLWWDQWAAWAGWNARPIALYVLTPARIDGLALGALVALVLRADGGLETLRRWARPMTLAGGAGFAGSIAADHLAGWHYTRDGYTWTDSFAGSAMQTVGYTFAGMMFAGLLAAALTAAPGRSRRWIARLFDTWFLKMLGKYSYALYLFHMPLRAAIRDVAFGPAAAAGARLPFVKFPRVLGSELPAQMVFYALASAAAIVLAWLSWHLFEKHFLKLKRYFPSDRSR
ncbi:MAG: acyltransferase [Phycisphaerales bacterium]|nr:acyltransferase [Phycisphaerales bacterium]